MMRTYGRHFTKKGWMVASVTAEGGFKHALDRNGRESDPFIEPIESLGSEFVHHSAETADAAIQKYASRFTDESPNDEPVGMGTDEEFQRKEIAFGNFRLYLLRVNSVHSARVNESASMEIRMSHSLVWLTDLTPADLRAAARFFSDYAREMEGG